jgi:hypothetical protein
MRAKTSVLGLVAVLLLGGCGDDKDDKESSAPATTVAPATTTTLSQAQLDKQKAQRIVLTAPDLPGYAQDPPDPSSQSSPEFEAAANACVNNNPVIVPLRTENDPRGATSPDFSKGDTVTVSSAVTFAETEDQARTAMTDVSAATFPACFSRAFTAEIRRDPTYTNVSVTTTKLPAITAGDQSLGYRAVAKFRTQGTNVTANFDFTFIRVGRAVASIDDYSLTTAFPAAERLRLAQLIAGRMAAP